MSNIVGAIVGLQAVVKATNKQREESAEKNIESDKECTCSATRVLFFGGCKCGNL